MPSSEVSTATETESSSTKPIGGEITPDPQFTRTDGQCFTLTSSEDRVESAVTVACKNIQTHTVIVSSTVQERSSSPTNNNTSSSSACPLECSGSGTNEFSGGAVAGVAIGMLFTGLLVSGALFFFLLRRQKKTQYGGANAQQHTQTHNNDATLQSEKQQTVFTSAVATNIDDMLPQPVADDTITEAILKIRDNIKNHVRTFYHASDVPTPRINQAGLGDLAIATGMSTAVLASNLSNPSTRQNTLRLVIGWVLLSRCIGDREPTLLPGELSMLATSIPGKDGANTAQSAMHSKWKTLTGALLKERFGQNTQSRDFNHTFAGATADLDVIVEPFVQSSSDSQRGKNLDMILARSTKLAFLLFSQPGAFNFDFASENGGLVAFPALVQYIGDHGQVLRPARLLLEKELTA